MRYSRKRNDLLAAGVDQLVMVSIGTPETGSKLMDHLKIDNGADFVFSDPENSVYNALDLNRGWDTLLPFSSVYGVCIPGPFHSTRRNEGSVGSFGKMEQRCGFKFVAQRQGFGLVGSFCLTLSVPLFASKKLCIYRPSSSRATFKGVPLCSTAQTRSLPILTNLLATTQSWNK